MAVHSLLHLLDRSLVIATRGDVMETIRSHHWSRFLEPVIWAAARDAETNAVIEWVVTIMGNLGTTVEVHDNILTPHNTTLAFQQLRQFLRGNGITNNDGLGNWLQQQGVTDDHIAAVRYIGQYAHEHILDMACEFAENVGVSDTHSLE